MRCVKLLSLFVLSLLLVSSPSQAGRQRKLHVGIVLRLKDNFNDTIPAIVSGIETAKSLFEKDHPEVQVVMHRYSHNEDLESVVAAAARVLNDHISAVIGGELSEEAFVLRDRLAGNKVVFITPTSTNPAVTEGFPFAFRGCPSDRWVASQLAQFTVEKLKPRAVGIIHNVSSPYTDFQSKQFKETLLQLTGGRASRQGSLPIFEEKVVRDTMNFEPQIRKFMENRVTHVVMLTHQNDLLRFAPQAAAQGFHPVYIGSDGWGSNEHVTKSLISGSYPVPQFTAFRNSFWNEDNGSLLNKRFTKEYASIYHKAPGAWSAIAFDTAWVLMHAMNQASNPKDSSEIRRKLESTRLQTLTNDTFTFDSDRSPRTLLPIYRLDRSGIRYEGTLK